MLTFKKTCLFFSLFLFLVLISLPVYAQDSPAPGEKILNLDDYTRWKRIESASISPDGNWVTYAYRPNDGDPTLYVKSLKEEKLYEIPKAKQPVFSEDSRWVGYLIDPAKEEAEKLRRDRKPVLSKAEITDLKTGEKFSVDGADSIVFSKNSKFCAIKKARTNREAKHLGSDLILRDLNSGAVFNIGNVAEFAFNDQGSHLGFSVDADQKAGNGVLVRRLGDGTLRVLDSGEANYSHLVWNEEGTALAVLKGKEIEDMVRKENILLLFSGFEGKDIHSSAYNPAEDESFPDGFVLSELGRLNWQADSYHIYGKDVEAAEQRFFRRLETTSFEERVFNFRDPLIHEIYTEAEAMVRTKIEEHDRRHP